MTSLERTRQELLEEISSLRLRLEEAEDTLRAIGNGEVDAFVVSGPEGEQIFTLKGAEQPYRVLVETMSEGAATLAADGTILYCNSRLSSLLRVPLEKLIGTRFGSYVAAADLPLFTARVGSCPRECITDEIQLLSASGEPLPVLFSCCANDQSSQYGISAVVTDLTQQKRNEEIASSEQLARSIIEQAGEAILVCDDAGIIIRASRLAHVLCGENPLLQYFDELLPLRLVDADCLFSVRTPLGGGSLESVEVELTRDDGQVSNLLLNASPLVCARNLITGCVVTLIDITERKRTEVELRESELRLQASYSRLQIANEETLALNEELHEQQEQLQEQNRELTRATAERARAEAELGRLNLDLESRVAERTAELAASIERLKEETAQRIQAVEALREKEQLLIQQSRQAALGEMIGNIAHQWRQPLNTLALTIQQMGLYYQLGQFSAEYLNQAIDGSMELIQHMSNTIDDFRNYFKPDKEKVEFGVAAVAEKTLSLIEDRFKSKLISVELVAQDDAVIFGYQNEFAQVLLNILNNASDAFKEREGRDAKVKITVQRENGRSVVTISDNAGGIPEAVIGRIFEPYFTTKGPQDGTGVGLYMSKTIIEKNMGGKLSARNTDEGAEFRIEV